MTASAPAASPTTRETIAVNLRPGLLAERTSRASFAADAEVYAVVTVNGADMASSGSGRTVDFAGAGVIVRLVSARAAGPIRVRMASVRTGTVRVVVALRSH